MKLQKHHFLLAIIFFGVLAFRLFFAFKTPYFSYDSYFDIRQISQIMETGIPSFEEPITMLGRTFFFLPLFHFIVAVFGKIMTLQLALKIVPAVFISSLVIVVYLLSSEITRNKQASLFAALLSGFIPILIEGTANHVTVYTLSLPLFFFTLFCLMKISDHRFIPAFIISLLLLTLLQASSLFLIIGLLFYVAFVYFDDLSYSKAELELIFFSFLFVVWLAFIVFKKPLLVHGIYVIWQNLPDAVIGEYFSNFSILKAIYQIGIFPFLFGIYVIYMYIFREKRKSIYLFMSFALSLFFLLWLRLIQLQVGLIFLGIILAVLSAQFYKLFEIYLQKTVIARFRLPVLAAFITIIVLTTAVPALQAVSTTVADVPPEAEVNALTWLKTAKNPGVVIATPNEGYLIEALAGKPAVLDSNYLLVTDSDQRYEDIKTIYTTPYETEAIRLLNKYEVKYILATENTKNSYGVDKPAYVSDPECFNEIYDRGVFIYELICEVDES